MAKVLVTDTYLSDIANAIRAKNGSSTTYKPSQMAAAVTAIPTSSSSLQTKTNISPIESSQTITPDSGYDGLSSVQINAISSTYVGSEISRKTSSDVINRNINPWEYSTNDTYAYITHNISVPNGYYALDGTKGFTVQVQSTGVPTQAAATITPTESEQTAVEKWKWTTGDVKIGAISSTYVGSGITGRSSSDLTASGATVTVPAGYYSSQATKSVSTMTLPTSAASSATSGYSSKATISRSTSTRYINIPPGYNSTGGYYTISATPNGTVTAPSSISGTSATISTGTNTLTLTKTISVTPSVTTAGYVSSGTAGNSSVSLTASITTKAAATITPGTSNQTIASGTYLTGTQTIAGDADLVGSNILSGVSIFGVAGTVTFQTYYTGSSAPSSSLGANGDIYLQTS